MIRLTCPTCEAVLLLPRHTGGDKVACSKCGQKLLVPQLATLDELNELAMIVQELKSRIPDWICTLRRSAGPSTLTNGIIGKCCRLTENLFKSAVLLMQSRRGIANPQLPLPQTYRLNMGDLCRLMKKQQRESLVFRDVNPREVGEVFDLLDKIVSWRNKLVHMNYSNYLDGNYSVEERAQILWAKEREQILDLLDHVCELCDSWLVKKLLLWGD